MTTRDVAAEAHAAAAAFIEKLAELEELETETGEQQEWPATASPYCGCDTCDLREGLFAAWPVFLSGVVEVLVAEGHGAAAELVHERLAVPGYGSAAAA